MKRFFDFTVAAVALLALALPLLALTWLVRCKLGRPGLHGKPHQRGGRGDDGAVCGG